MIKTESFGVITGIHASDVNKAGRCVRISLEDDRVS